MILHQNPFVKSFFFGIAEKGHLPAIRGEETDPYSIPSGVRWLYKVSLRSLLASC